MEGFYTVPKGTRLFRGCMKGPVIGTDKTVYFTRNPKVAEVYGRCIIQVETLKDIHLLDLSTKAAWDIINSIEWGKDEAIVDVYSGKRFPTYPHDFIKTSVKSGLFQDGKVQDTPCVDRPEKECTNMEWHGLVWGPEAGQYKRSSTYSIDKDFMIALREKCTKDNPKLCFAGIYAPFLPSPNHTAMDMFNKKHPAVFTEEFAFFGLPEDTFKFIEEGGKRRKTRRRKSTRKTRSKK